MPFKPVTVYPLDINLASGVGRILGSMVRSGNVVLDTPHGGDSAPEAASMLYVGVTGNVTVVKWDGTTQLYTNLAAGVIHKIASLQINSAGTTATGLIWGS